MNNLSAWFNKINPSTVYIAMIVTLVIIITSLTIGACRSELASEKVRDQEWTYIGGSIYWTLITPYTPRDERVCVIARKSGDGGGVAIYCPN